jgi:hypothetical protein
VLFCGAVFIVDYVTPNGRMVEEFKRFWKEVFDVYLKFSSGIFGRTKENQGDLSQDS